MLFEVPSDNSTRYISIPNPQGPLIILVTSFNKIERIVFP